MTDIEDAEVYKNMSRAMGLLLAMAGIVKADDPRPMPLTRPEMKRFLEDMKVRKPRIPLPELTAGERTHLDERAAGYESRLRSLYLSSMGGPGGQGTRTAGAAPGGGQVREQDPKMTLDYAFKTELFWIVSRTNNCQYCLGHQESKLLGAGLEEDEIALLDGDWSEFTPAQREAFAYARKITYEPNLLSDADFKALREFYTDLQILEMTLSVAGNNSINRWKEGVGVPQSTNGGGFGSRRSDNPKVAALAPDPVRSTSDAVAHSYLSPTSEKYQKSVTRVAPLVKEEGTGKPSRRTVSRRPALESRAEVEKALEVARQRSPRLPLLSEADTRAVVSSSYPEGPLPQWVRLLANFPRDGVRVATNIRSAEEKGELSPLLKAQVSWVIARQDRAWYATGQAMIRLRALGETDDRIFELDGVWTNLSAKDRALLNVARKLAVSPVVLTDEDVTAAVKLAGPRDVVQLISYTTNRASFDRITEAAALPLEK